MKEFTSIEELAKAKTKEQIIEWASEMQKCPYDFDGEAYAEDVCKGGEDAEQCNECWKMALKDIKCKEEKPKKSKNLAAKDSNAGVLALKEECKTMTREEFPYDKVCPSAYGFPNTMNGCDNKHAINHQCQDCWKCILDGMEFKEKDKPTEDVDFNKFPMYQDPKSYNSSQQNDAIVKELQHIAALLSEIKMATCKTQVDVANVVTLLNQPTTSK